MTRFRMLLALRRAMKVHTIGTAYTVAADRLGVSRADVVDAYLAAVDA
jgi:hypothetical protein